MNFVVITQDLMSNESVQESEFLQHIVTSTLAIYPDRAPIMPWAGYLAEVEGTFVGTCAYKSPPAHGQVEIAYFTFSGYEGQGLATQMVQWLIANAFAHGVEAVTAQTLPELNASSSILGKLFFDLVGTVKHPEDGKVWEWQKHRSTYNAYPNKSVTGNQ